MKLLATAFAFVALSASAWADDPPKPPAPVVPVAAIVVPAKQPLVIYQDGTVSKPLPDGRSSAAWQVIEPTGVVTRTEGNALIIPDWTPGQKYTLVLTAIGDTVPPYVFRFASITAPGTAPTPQPDVPPSPDPVTPPAPITPPPPAGVDAFGMVAATRDIVGKLAWTDGQLKWRRMTLAGIFADQSDKAAAAGSLQDAVSAAGKGIKAGIGAESYAGWEKSIIGPIRSQLTTLVASGKIQTPAHFAEALSEVAAGLGGN